MKMKRTLKMLKTSLLLIGISLLLWNCEKEEFNESFIENSTITVQQIQSKFNNQFDVKYFPYLKRKPLWEKLEKSNYKGKTYYEIPFYNIENIDRKKSTSISYDKLVAFINEKNEIELNILHFYIPKIDSHNSNALSLKDTENLSGLLSFYDLKNHILDVSSYKNGKELIKNYAVKNVDRNINELNPRIQSEDEVCETFVEEWAVVSYYYWTYTDGTIEVISTDIEYFSREYSSCDGDGESGGGNSGSSEIVIEIPVEILNKLTDACGNKIFTELENGIFKDDPIKPEVSISNTENLNFSEQILSLFNESNETHYTIQNGTPDNPNANASTDPLTNTTTINDIYLQSATNLSIARTMIHEQVHAYINSTLKNHPGFLNMTLAQRMREYAKTKGITDVGEFHHDFMGGYIDAMAYSLYEWDKIYGEGKSNNFDPTPDDLLGWDYYQAMAWGGLFSTDIDGKIVSETDSFKELVPLDADRQIIADIVVNETKGNEDAEGEKCDL